MLFKHAALTSQASARYGAALSSTTRKDIAAHFMDLMWETLKHGEDLAKLMIKYKFMDQLPMANGENSK